MEMRLMIIPKCLFALIVVFGVSFCDSDSDKPEGVIYEPPVLNDPSIYFFDHFDDVAESKIRWIKSQGKKKHSDGDVPYDGMWEIEQSTNNALPNDYGLVLKNKAKHSAVASMLKKPFKFDLKPLVVQYEVLFQEGQECGGAYLKLLSETPENKDLNKFTDVSQYSIMFGPDKCGNDHKLHFIFQHRNPLNGTFEEKHCKKPDVKLDSYFSDKKPHLYTLVLYPDNSYKIMVDNSVVNKGSLLFDFTPEVNPPAEIDDPTDVRPADWDFREKIPDPTAKKPDDWNEDAPATIPDLSATKPDGWLDDEPVDISDPEAEKPADWDEEMDGVWEAPLIPNPVCQGAPGCGTWVPPTIDNPDYKGKWVPPLIDNPNYKGEWRPKRIPNPDFFEDKHPFRMATIVAVGFELWSMSPNILFDNIIITDNEKIAAELASKTFDVKNIFFNKNDDSIFDYIVNHTKQKPWLWAVYIVLLLVPVVLAVLFCFGASSKDKDSDKDAIRKKTDAYEPDDDVDGSERPDDAEYPQNSENTDNLATDDADSEQNVDQQNSEVESSSEQNNDEKDEEEEEETEKKSDRKSPGRRRVRAD